jgi:hypothetical protein
MSDVRCPMSDVRSPMSDVRCQMSEVSAFAYGFGARERSDVRDRSSPTSSMIRSSRLYELPVIRFGVRYPDGARYRWPCLRDLL